MKKAFPVDIDKYPCRNTSLKNLRNEKWGEVPGLEEYYHVSNYGRIKSLSRDIYYSTGKIIHKKERIIMAGISPVRNYFTNDFTYQLQVSLKVNNKVYYFSVARLVYYCFNNNFFDLEDHSLFIIQKDGNGLNCYYKNLIALNATDKQKRIYKRERIITCFAWLDMKAVAKKDLQRRYKPVTQYNTKGKRIKTFKSIKEAGEITGIARSHISAVINGYWLTAGSYVWRQGKGEIKIDLGEYFKAGKKSYKEKRGKKVAQFAKEGKPVEKYLSISDDAKQTGIPFSNISRAVKGELPTAGKFIWKQQDE